MKLTRLAILITLTCSARPVLATEFNVNMLNTEDRKHADLSAFSRDGYIAPGDYLLDIRLNDQTIREQYPVSVVPVKGSGKDGDDSAVCVTPEMVALLGLKDGIVRGLKPVPGTGGPRCLELRSADSQVR
ncbi:TPA: fimbrial biogenesis outer membrane usher protein, partial [Klebsiella oxytoca]|nr:fimbrial biogenesis outer membrane usher protein [Klebsiella oxytoca]